MSAGVARLRARRADVATFLTRRGPWPVAVGQWRSAARQWGWVATVAAVLVRPGLWSIAVRQCRTVVPHGWWRRRPHLPIPDRSYLAFRRVTQYGDSGAPVAPADVIHYLSWCRQMRSATRCR